MNISEMQFEDSQLSAVALVAQDEAFLILSVADVSRKDEFQGSRFGFIKVGKLVAPNACLLRLVKKGLAIQKAIIGNHMFLTLIFTEIFK